MSATASKRPKRRSAPSLAWPNMPAPVWGSQDAPKRNTTGWVDPDPDPEESDLPSPADVIAMLGFDPDAIEDSTDAEASEDADPPIAADADWDPDKHKRGQPGNAGQFSTAAHAKTLPAPSSYGGVSIKKQAHTIAAEHLTKGSHHDEAAQAIKDFVAQHEHPSVANYANKLLEHIAQAHGVHPNALGKAYPKKMGVASKPGITQQPKPAAPPPPAPAPASVKPLNPIGPDPHPDSPAQQKIWQLADQPGTPADKIEQIKQEMLGMPKGGFTETFAKQWIEALGGDPTIPATAQAKPAPAPVATPGVKGAAARVAKAEKLAEAAQKVPTTNSAAALAIAPSLGPQYWKAISPAIKQSVKNYGDGKYDPINDALRGDDPAALTPEAEKDIANIDDLFDHDEAVSTDAVILMRGENTPKEIIDKWKATLTDGWPPCIYTRTGYTSASMAHQPAFAHKPVWFHFTAPKGTRMVGLAGHVGHYEDEMLLQHGQSMEIYQIYESGGKTHVKATLK
jgi:hypothetical protein